VIKFRCIHTSIHPSIHGISNLHSCEKNWPLIHITIKICSNFPMSSIQSRTNIKGWWDMHAP
jgi:hypothetical protein